MERFTSRCRIYGELILLYLTTNTMLMSIEQQQEQQDKYIKLLQEANKEDSETAHIKADSIICDLLEEL
jgi:hypothetical protein